MPRAASVLASQASASKDFPIISDQVIDLAETQGNVRLMAEHVMAHEKALYKGHAVAAVASGGVESEPTSQWAQGNVTST